MASVSVEDAVAVETAVDGEVVVVPVSDVLGADEVVPT